MRICEGHAAVLKQAQIMFRQNMVLCQENVVNHLVPKGVSQEGNRLFAQDLVEGVCRACDAWADQRFTQLGATAALQLRRFAQLDAKKWKEACLANEELCLELAQGMLEFEQKYLEDGPGQPENCKKMIKRMRNAYYATFLRKTGHLCCHNSALLLHLVLGQILSCCQQLSHMRRF